MKRLFLIAVLLLFASTVAFAQTGKVKLEGNAAVLAKFYGFFDPLTTPGPPPLTIR
ncbi:MAG: hypothetical protein JST85_01520 [Acidobacteria bacterium]|nr:hypothetical protein [Acidobacteriota bacterium]